MGTQKERRKYNKNLRTGYNFEIKNVKRQPNIVRQIKINIVGWLGHLRSVNTSRGNKIILKGNFEGK